MELTFALFGVDKLDIFLLIVVLILLLVEGSFAADFLLIVLLNVFVEILLYLFLPPLTLVQLFLGLAPCFGV
jgi:hypothetical protein